MAFAHTDDIQLVGREREMSELDRLLSDAGRGQPSVGFLSGHLGSGKSSLVNAVVARAEARGFRTGLVRPRHGHAGLRPVPLQTVRVALCDALSPEEGNHALLAAEIPDDRPLLIAIDGCAAADPRSLEWLTALVACPRPRPVAVVLAEAPARMRTRRRELADLLAHAHRIKLTDLDVGDVARIARSADHAAVARVHAATGGNPMLVSAVLSGSGISAVATRVRDELRLAHPAAAGLARVMTILDRDGDLPLIAELAELDLPTALAAVDALVMSGIVRNSVPLAFTAPMFRDVVLGDIPIGTRIALHVKAAKILAEAGADVERVARQLVSAGPVNQPWAVRALRDAAGQARGRGDSVAAAGFLQCASRIRLSTEDRVAVLRELAEVVAETDPDRAVLTLNTVLRKAESPDTITDVTLALVRVLDFHNRLGVADEVVRHAYDRLAEYGHEGQERLVLGYRMRSLHRPRGQQLRIGADALTWLPADERTRALASVLRAVAGTNRGEDRAAAAEQARQATTIDAWRAPELFWHSIWVLVCAGEENDARELCDAVDHLALLRGKPPVRPEFVSIRAVVRRATGDLERAIGALRTTFGTGPLARFAAALLVECLVRSGATAQAEQVLAEHEDEIDSGDGFGSDELLFARGVLRAAEGNPAEALADFIRCGARLRARGVHNPAVLPWRSRAARCQVELNRGQAAMALANEELAAARRWGAGRPIGIALHALAMSHTCGERIVLLDKAMRALDTSGAPVELASAHHDLGEALVEARRYDEAKENLGRAHELAVRCGARTQAERTRDALGGLDAATAGAEVTLTPQESKVARLAADGHSNPRIAEWLWVTRRTVEFHLSSAYRKLGISGRGELGPALEVMRTAPARLLPCHCASTPAAGCEFVELAVG